jgi:cell division septal protein FtsQ
VTSAHVAPRGHKSRVARPVVRVEPARVTVPLHRRHRRPKPLVAPPTMTQRRTSSLESLLSARALSAVLLVILVVVLALFIQSDAFYVHRIEVGGLFHLTAEEVFGLSGVANMHVFWIDPAEVRRNILRSSSVADVEVLVNWPPHLVQIEVQERQPALVWEQAGVRTWIDVRGRVMPQRTDLEGMLRIVVEGEDTPVGPNVVIPQDVVDGALQLKTLYPDLEALLYDPVEGLGLQEGRGWRVWFGSGTDMPAKLNVYNAIVADLTSRGVQPEYIDVGDINAPYYKIWWQVDEGEPAPPADGQ